ncbi:MAG TPA: TIGR03560 family F420-dependent LLM class oxidoreductase [Acidimicrobiia bacterium]|nr:TIGR03560 family F420-dependent LLM class oxidoreductase [Acidimicrobiia bacterium]
MEPSLPVPSLVVLVGPSGAGKSTWASARFTPSQIVSSDALRAMVGAGEDDQTAGTTAFSILEQIVTERLRRGMTTVIDTLGLDQESRRRWIGLAREADVPAHTVVFDTPGPLCMERNESRTRPIPKTVLRKQLSRFNQVREEIAGDGFDMVHVLGSESSSTGPGPISVTSEATYLAERKGHTFGLMVSSFVWDTDMGSTLADVARRAESAGFRDLWVMDHFRQIRGVGRPWEDIPEAYTALAFVAGVTEKIRLGAMVTGITHRHPIVLGKVVASLDVLSGGRANCGLGIAWDEEEHASYGIEFPPTKERYELLEETLQVLPLLWGKGTPPFAGKHIVSPGLISYPRPIQDHIPIMIGGSGEKKTLRLVARYADACNLFGDPDRVRHKVEVLSDHCAVVGRHLADIEVTHLTNALAAPDRRALRERVEKLRERNTTAETYIKRNNAGTVDELVELFAGYARAGASNSVVSIPDVASPGSIEAFADVIAGFDSP